MKPAISIIVPVYNIESHLERCLESILAQTFTDFEVIIVNDGSSDISGVICDGFAEKDKRIRVIHKAKEGVSSARNTGIGAAKGEYIGFVDGDDYILEDMYETLHTLCTSTGSHISVCKLGREVYGELINDDSKETYIKELTNEEAMGELFKGILYRFSLCNKLFKKTCFEDVFFPHGRIHEDLATTYKLFANSYKAVYTNYIGYVYVKRKNSILTSNYYESRLDAFIGWDEILSFMNQKYPQLSSEVNTCFAYSCVDHAYYILNQVEDKKDRKQYLTYIQLYVRKYYKEIRSRAVLSLKYRFIARILNYNVNLLIIFNSVKKNQFFPSN